MNFADIAKIDVNPYVEKKGQLTYLSWAWAVDQLQRLDDNVSWSYGEPQRWGDTVMVFCTVTAFGRSRTAQLPVMDHKNKAVSNPDAFAVNTAMQRCLAKAIALHGLGLYIYAGEDLPPSDEKPIDIEQIAADYKAALRDASGADRRRIYVEAIGYAREIGSVELAQILKAYGEELKAYA